MNLPLPSRRPSCSPLGSPISGARRLQAALDDQPSQPLSARLPVDRQGQPAAHGAAELLAVRLLFTGADHQPLGAAPLDDRAPGGGGALDHRLEDAAGRAVAGPIFLLA